MATAAKGLILRILKFIGESFSWDAKRAIELQGIRAHFARNTRLGG
jgi:hypothetical protein